MDLLLLVTLILFVLGLFNPQASLFWYNKQRTRRLSAILYGVILVMLIGLKSSPPEIDPPATTTTQTVVEPDTMVSESPVKLEEAGVTQKLKARAARDWPNDYTTQEYWINQELEDYKYMLTIPNDPIKRQAEHDWPYDYTTQKYWYSEQIEAKERLNND